MMPWEEEEKFLKGDQEGKGNAEEFPKGVGDRVPELSGDALELLQKLYSFLEHLHVSRITTSSCMWCLHLCVSARLTGLSEKVCRGFQISLFQEFHDLHCSQMHVRASVHA